MITICFYLEQRSSSGPDLTEWFALKSEFGCELIAIEWTGYVANADTAQVTKVPSIYHVHRTNLDATHVLLKEGAGVELSTLPAPTGDVVFYIGRNSHAFRSDLDGLAGLTWAHLSGGDLWAHEAARAVLET